MDNDDFDDEEKDAGPNDSTCRGCGEHKDDCTCCLECGSPDGECICEEDADDLDI